MTTVEWYSSRLCGRSVGKLTDTGDEKLVQLISSGTSNLGRLLMKRPFNVRSDSEVQIPSQYALQDA